MPSKVSVKSITNNVGWSILSKTSTFGLKFVTVPILARILSVWQVLLGGIASVIIHAALILLTERKRKLVDLA